jgi:hypothetical protein
MRFDTFTQKPSHQLVITAGEADRWKGVLFANAPFVNTDEGAVVKKWTYKLKDGREIDVCVINDAPCYVHAVMFSKDGEELETAKKVTRDLTGNLEFEEQKITLYVGRKIPTYTPTATPSNQYTAAKQLSDLADMKTFKPTANRPCTKKKFGKAKKKPWKWF